MYNIQVIFFRWTHFWIWDVYRNVWICVRQIHKTNKLLLKNALITIAAQKFTRLESFTYLIKNCSVSCKHRCRRDLIIQLKIFQDCVCRIIWKLTLPYTLVSWLLFLSSLSWDVNFHYHIANKLNYFDQNWIIFCIGESICRYARWKFWKGLFANQTHYTRLWICPNVKIQESFCTESFIFILLCDCLNDCLIDSLNYCTFLLYFWYISH